MRSVALIEEHRQAPAIMTRSVAPPDHQICFFSAPFPPANIPTSLHVNDLKVNHDDLPGSWLLRVLEFSNLSPVCV
jgi:hypothetical protein